MLSNRRSFLRSLGLLGAGAALSPLWVPSRALAQAGIDPHRRFVFAYFEGAWDIQLGPDPRDPALFPDSARDTTRIELGWSRLAPSYRSLVTRSNMSFGPAIGRTAEHHDVLCAVRGMTMETLTHPVGARYFLTGKTPAGLNARGSSAGSTVVDQLAAVGPVTEPIPNLHVDTEAYYEGSQAAARPYHAGAGSVYALVNAFTSGIGDALPDLVLATLRGTAGASLLDAYRASAPTCDPAGLSARGAHRELRDAQAKVSEMLRGSLGQAFDFQNVARPEMAALNARYGSARLGSSGTAAAVAYQALRYGISRAVTVRLQRDLDTHTARWATDQPALLNEAFDALGTLLTDLRTTAHPAGGTLLDHTTVLAFSEFSRTPYLNAAGGRDHSLTNACLLAGAGVPRGRVVGASSDIGMEPQPIDPVTGAVRLDAAGRMVRPTEVLASVLQSAGYDTDALRAVGMPCLMA